MFSTALADFQSQRAEVGVQVIPTWRRLMQIGLFLSTKGRGSLANQTKDVVMLP